MSKSSQTRTAKPSAVHPEMLAQYRRAARAPSMREEIRALMRLVDDYDALIRADDLEHALGAGLELVDVGLRFAATPSETATDRQYRAGFFELHFGSLMQAFSHGHVARIADAAVTAERSSAANSPHNRA